MEYYKWNEAKMKTVEQFWNLLDNVWLIAYKNRLPQKLLIHIHISRGKLVYEMSKMYYMPTPASKKAITWARKKTYGAVL